MPMRIARPMIGMEGLQSGTTPVRSGVGASMISFAESMGENLTAPVAPGDAHPTAKADDPLLRAGTTSQKVDEEVAKVPPALESVGEIQRSIKHGITSEALAAEIETTVGTLSNPGVGVAASVPDSGEKQIPAATEPPPKLPAQPTGTDEGREPAVCNPEKFPASGEHQIRMLPVAEGADSSKQTKATASASRVAGAKGKETESLPRHKEKHGADEMTSEGQAVQQGPHSENLMAVQPSTSVDVQAISFAVSHAVASKASDSSSEEVKESAGSVGKPATLHALRQGQATQALTKSPHDPQVTSGTTAEKQVEPAPHEGEVLIGATAAKPDTAEHRPLAQDEVRTATPVGLQQGVASVPQVHASAMEPTGKIANASPAQPVHTQQMGTTVPQTTYSLGEHGTITATAKALEVAVPGGTHGWLKVRAELGGDGSVHASMSTNSAEGTEVLRRELPQLTSYLHQEQVRVNSVVVHAPTPTEFSNQGPDHGLGQTMNGGLSDGNPRDPESGGSRSSHAQPRISSTAPTPDEDRDFLPSAFGSAGGWLSVRA